MANTFLSNGLLGMGGFGGSPMPSNALLGGYYDPAEARKYQMKQMLLGLGAGLMAEKGMGKGAALALAAGDRAGEQYRENAMDAYKINRQQGEDEWNQKERARTQAQWDAQDQFAQNPSEDAFRKAYPQAYATQYGQTLFPEAMGPGDRYKAVGGNIYDVVTGQWMTPPGGSYGPAKLPLGYRMTPEGNAELIPGVRDPNAPKPYVPGPGDRTAIRNAKEENALLEQTLTNLDEASGLVNNANSGYFSSARARVAENVRDSLVPDAVFGSPQQGRDTLRLQQIMDAEALASMGKLLKGPTSDRDVQIMLQTVNDPNASPKRKQDSIDQVKRTIRAQIAANKDIMDFSLNGPNAVTAPIVTEDGYTIEEQ